MRLNFVLLFTFQRATRRHTHHLNHSLSGAEKGWNFSACCISSKSALSKFNYIRRDQGSTTDILNFCRVFYIFTKIRVNSSNYVARQQWELCAGCAILSTLSRVLNTFISWQYRSQPQVGKCVLRRIVQQKWELYLIGTYSSKGFWGIQKGLQFSSVMMSLLCFINSWVVQIVLLEYIKLFFWFKTLVSLRYPFWM